MEFRQRSGGVGPVFVGTYRIGDGIESEWEPAIGNVVTLHVGDVIVIARITNAVARGYEGAIIGFENHDSYDFQGKAPEDTVHFRHENIFSCSKA